MYHKRFGLSDTWRRRIHFRCRPVPDFVRIILLLLAVPTFLLPSLGAAQTENVPTGTNVVFSYDHYSMYERKDEQARVHTITVKTGPNALGGVSWALLDGGALRGTDYEPVTQGGRFATGRTTTHEIKIKIIDDDLVEPLETFSIRLSNPTGAATFPGGKSHLDATVEITDNDHVSITVDPVTVTEGASAQFHLKLGRVLRAGESAQVFVSTGRYDKNNIAPAEPVDDYSTIAPARSVRWSNGDQTKIVAVSTIQDEIDEPSEAFTLLVTNQHGVDLSDFVIPTATILDDDPVPVISVASPPVKEGNDGYTAMPFNLMLDRPSAGTVTLNYVVSNASTAKWGEDFKAFAKGVLAFLPNETKKTLTVEVAGDTRSEPNETVVLHLSKAVNATLAGAVATLDVIGTIMDDDTSEDPVAVLSLTSPPHSVEEGRMAVFRAELDRALTTDVEFQWRTFNVEARGDEGDFTRVPWTRVTIPAGDTGVDLKVNTILDEEVGEGIETFAVAIRLITTRGVVLKDSLTNQKRVTAGILDGPAVSIHDAQIVTEGDAALFPVTLSAVVATDVTVSWKTVDGSAQAGSDYRAVPDGQVTIAAGDKRATVRVLTLQDTIDEDNQGFSVILTKVDGAVLNVETAKGVIRDDDARPQMTIADASVAEGGTARFRVMLSTASERPVSVRWQTADDTASAQSKDYVAASLQTVTIPAGGLHADIEVVTLDDKASEGNERFKVLLSHAYDGILKDDEALGTIIDNEPLLVSVSPARLRGAVASLPKGRILEPPLNGSTELLFDIRLAYAANVPVTVNVQVLNGDENGKWPATRDIPNQFPRGDYLVTPIEPGQIQFMPGETSKTLTVFVLGDTLVEGYETFRVALDNPSGASVDPDRRVSTVTIRDDSGMHFFVPAGQPHVVREGGKISVTLERKPRDISELAKQLSARTLNTTYRVCLYGGVVGNSYVQKDVPGRAVVSGGTLTLDDDVFLSKARQGQEGNHCLIETDSGIPTVVWTSFPVDTWKQTVEIQTIQDNHVEGDETVTLLFRTTDILNGRRTPQSAMVRHEITILDDDAHRVRVENASASEGSPVEFKIYVDPPLADGQTGTVNYVTANGTALAGVDYTARSLRQITLSAPAQAGAPAATISIPTTEDELSELTETFTVTLSDPSSGFSLGDADQRTATATILDDDRLLAYFENTVVTEGTDAVVTARLSHAVEEDVTITWKTVADSAESPADFDAVSGASITIPAGVRTASVRVVTKKDDKDEFDEDFKVVATAVNLVSAHIGAAAVVTIRDHDPATLSFGAYANATIEENRDWRSETPTLTGMPFKHVTWTLEGDDATRFKINANTGRLRLSAQNYEKQKDKDKNNVYEVTVRATDEDGNSAASSLTVTVTNVETRVRIDSDLKVEGEDLQFEVVRESSTGGNVPITFKWRTWPDKDGENPADETDYTPVTKWQTVDMGKKSTITLSISTTDDGVDESHETMRVQLSDLSDGESDDVVFSDAGDVALGLIFDNDTRGIRVTPMTLILDETDDPSTQGVIENQKTYAVQLTSQPTGTGTVTVNVASGDTTAATVDKESLVFPAQTWNAAQTVTVTGKNDDTDNANNRRTVSINHTLSADNTDYKEVTAGAVAVTVNDGDAVAVSVADASAVNEGNDSQTTVDMTFRVTLDKASENVVTVPFTLGGTAVSGEDYQAPASLSLTIAAGSKTGDITVPVRGDTLDEVDETVIVTLGAPTNATVSSDEGAGTGTGRITDDDAAPTGITLTASPASVGEEDGATTITVDAAVNGTTQYAAAQTVTVSVDGGTATAGTDYKVISNFDITIDAGAVSEAGTFTLTPENDDIAEENETVNVTGASGALTVTADEITITDDDATPTVRLVLTPATIAESGASNVSTVTAELSGKSHAAVTVDVSVPGSAPVTQTGTTLTIEAGATASTGTVTLTAVNNDVDGPNKTVTVSGKASGGGVAHPADVTLTIEDDEAIPAVTLKLSPATIAESGASNVSTVTAELSGKSSASVTVTVAAAPGVDTAPTDYTLSPLTTLTIAAGATTSTGSVTIMAVDNDVDAPNKTVIVSGTAAGGGVAHPVRQTLTITDDDTRGIKVLPPVLVLAEVDDPSTQGSIENQKTYTVQLMSQPTGTVTITLKSSDTTVATVSPATLEFTASAWGAKTVTVTGEDDEVDNDGDRHTTSITHSVDADGTDYEDLTATSVVVVVTDNEATPVVTLALDPATIDESGASNMSTVTAALDHASHAAVTVEVSVPAGSPVTQTGTTLTIAAAATASTGTVTLTAADNNVDADNAAVAVSGTAAGGGVADPADVTLTLTDDDAAPTTLTLTVDTNAAGEGTPTTVAEGGSAATVRVTATLGGLSTFPEATTVTVEVGDTADSATEGTDYATVGTQEIEIAAGASSGFKDFTLTPTQDTLAEGDETITLDGTLTGVTVTDAEITLTDDDTLAWTVAVAPAAIAEDGGASTVTVSTGGVTFATDQTITLGLTGTATKTADYTIGAETLTLTAGQTSVTTTVTGVDDPVDDDAETVVITASVGGSTVGAAQTVTITDDDDAPSAITLTVDADTGTNNVQSSIAEGRGAKTVRVTATITSASRFVAAQTVSVDVGNADDDTATEGTDYANVATQEITIAAGASSGYKDFTLTPTDDEIDEPDEAISIDGTLAGVTFTQTAITITDDDTRGITVSAAASGVTVAEADNPGTSSTTENVTTYTVALNSQPTGTVTIDLESGDTDVATVSPASLEFTTAAWGAKTVTVTGQPDGVDNANNRRTTDITHTVAADETDYAAETAADVTVTVTDDEATPVVTLALDPATIDESGASNMSTVTAALDHASHAAVTVEVSVPAGSPVTQTGTTLTIAAGATASTGTVTLTAADNNVDADNAAVAVSGTAAGGGVADPADVTLTLTDDDAAPTTLTLTVDTNAAGEGTPTTVAEGGSAATVRVTATLGGLSTFPEATTVTVEVGDTADSATEGTDYATVGTQEIEIAAGASSGFKDFTLTPTQDTLAEGDETITLDGTLTGVTVTDAEITLTDDDAAPTTLTLTVDTNAAGEGTPTTVAEGGSAATVRVTATLGGLSTFPEATTVTVEVGDTADSATEGTDYATVGTQEIEIAAGASSGFKDFTLTPTQDTLAEGDETITLDGTLTGVTVTDAEITLTDDDTLAWTVAVAPAAIAEDGGASTVTVSTGGVTFATDQTITLGLTGTATKTADYTIGAETLTLTAGQTSVTTTVTGVDDPVDDDAETVVITASVGGSTVGAAQTVTITDDDDAPSAITLTVDADTGTNNVQSSIAEGRGAKTVRVTATITSASRFVAAQTVSVDVGNADDDTATEGTDYANVATQEITIAAGASSGYKDFTLTPTDDEIDEPDEAISIDGTLAGVTFTQTAITITDDDTRGITVSAAASGVTVAEADNPGTSSTTENVTTYTVALNSQPTGTVTIDLESGDTDVATVSPASLEFTTAAWGAKTVTVTGQPDGVDNANNRRTTDITHTVAADETDYAAETAADVTVTVTDDEATPVVTLALDPATIDESGASNMSTVTAALDHASHAAVTVEVSVPAGSPVTQTGTTLTIAAGATASTGTVTLTAADNNVDADNAAVAVSGTAAGGGVADPADVTLTLTDDDAAPTTLTLTVDTNAAGEGTPTTVAEGGSAATVRVTATLGGLSTFPEATTVTVEVGDTADSATEGTDYATVGTQEIEIAAGASSGFKDFTLTPTQDTLAEGDETITLDGTLTGVTVTDAEITLTDDDAAPTTLTLTVDTNAAGEGTPTTVAEGGSAATVRVTATLGGLSTFPEATTVTVEVGDTADSATEGTDYATVGTQEIEIAAGASSGFKDFTLTPTQDTLAEGDETITLDGTLTGVTVTDAEITLTDDDTLAWTVAVAPAAIAEDGGASTVTVSTGGVTFATDQTITLGLTGTATKTADYTIGAETLTLTAGQTSVTTTVTGVDDPVDDDAETVVITASVGGSTVGAAQTVTITDDDDAPSAITLTVDADTGTNNVQSSIAEGRGAKTVRVTATITSASRFVAAQTVSVDVGNADDDTATEGTDYANVATQEITIAAGASSGYKDFTLTPTDDEIDEPDEAISIDGTLAGVTFTQTAITITDDDTRGITVSAAASGVTVAEADNPGTSSTTENVTTYTVALNSQPTGTVTIDLESGDTDVATVSPASLEFTTAAWGAKTVTVTGQPDGVDNANNRRTTDITHTVAADETDYAAETAADVTVTVTDDEATPVVTLALDPATIDESGASNMSTVTAALDHASHAAVTVEVSVPAGSPVTQTGTTLTIAAGATASTGTVTLTAADNNVDADNAAVAVSGTAAGGGVADPADVTLTLTDDDAAPTTLTLTVDTNAAGEGTPTTVAEGGSAATVRVTATLGGLSTFPEATTVTVEVGDTADSATEGTDYATVGTQEIEIAAGASSGFKDFTLTPTQDTLAEGDETITLDGTLTGVTVTDAEITLTDDDAAPTTLTLTVDTNAAGEGTPTTVAEGGSAATVRVTATLGGLSTFPEATTVTVEVGDTADSATEGTDYATVGTQEIEIAAGASSGFKDFTLTPTQDTLAEGDETITLDGTLTGVTVTDAEITLTDDDTLAWTVAVAPAAIAEDGGASTVTVSTGGATFAADQTVTLVLTGTATKTADYTIGAETLTLTAGQTSVTTTVTGVDDPVDDDAETVVITASVGGSTVGTAQTITITDDDTLAWTVAVAPASIAEDGGTSTVTVSTGGATFAADQTVTLVLTGTATKTDDYTIGSETLTLTAGQTSVTTTVTGVDDTVDDDAETVVITASVGGSTVGTAQTITITDDDTLAWTVAVAPASIAEDGGTSTVTVSTGGATFAADQTVTLVLTGTATKTDDYTIGSESLTLTAGQTSVTTTVTGVDDTVADAAETVVITASVGGSTVGTAQTITITDDDVAPSGATLSVDPAIVGEADGATVITVTATVDGAARTDATELTISVDPGTAQEADFESVEAFTLTIAAEATTGTATFTLTPVNDLIADDQETIIVSGTTTVESYTVTDATITLNNYDPPATILNLSVAPASVAEDGGDTPITLTARFGAGHRETDTAVTVTVVGDTASAADFAAVEAFTLTIPAGQADATKDFTFNPVDDAIHEGPETIAIAGTTTVADLTVYAASLTLTDNDAAPSGLTLRASPATIGEAAGATPVSVSARVEGGTTFPEARTVRVEVGGGTATSGEDYTAIPSFDFTIPAGATHATGTFTLTPVDDAQDEPDETIRVTGTSGGLTIDPDTIVLEDNDDISIMAIRGGRADEGTAVVFTVTRTGGTASAATVQWGTAADPAAAFPATAADYTAVPRQALHFAPGATRQQVAVSTTDDALDEADETFVVRLSGGSAQVVIAPDGGVATGTILDNDEPPELVIEDVTVEEGATATFPVTLSAVSGLPISVSWRTVEGTATEEQDYTGQHGRLTIPPGARTTQLVVPTIDDRELEEPEETYTLRLSDPQAVVLGGAASREAATADEMTANGMILDNDRARIRTQLKQVNDALLPWVGSALLRRHLDRITGCLQETGAAGPDLGAMVERAVRYAESQQTAQQTGGRQTSLWEALGDTRLAGSLGPAAPRSDQRPVTLCVGTNWRRLTNDGPVSWEGALLGANLNGHVRISEHWRVGLDVAHDQGRLDWQIRSAGEAGEWDLALTGVRPYVAWQTPTGAQVWGLVGYSGGTLAVTASDGVREGGVQQRTPVTHRHAAVGGAVPVWAGLGGGVRLRGEAWLGTLEVEDNGDLLVGLAVQTAGVRGLVDGEWAYEFGASQRLTPAVRLGVQYDDGAGGTGLEVGTDVGWEDLVWGLQGRVAARTLIVEGVVREWGLGGHMRLVPPDGLGPLLELSTARGSLADGRAQWWDQGLGGTPLGPTTPGIGVDLEAGWGLRVPELAGILTPYVGVGLVEETSRTLRLGGRLTVASGLGVAVEALRRERMGSPPEQGVSLQFRQTW